MKQSQREKTKSPKLNSKELFDLFSSDINWCRAFCAYFQTIPNIKSIYSVNIQRVQEWFEKTQEHQIVKKFVSERYDRRLKGTFTEVVYILDNECIILMNYRGPLIEILYSFESREVLQLTDSIRKFKQRTSEAYINLVVSDIGGLSLTSLKAKRPKCSIETNYNDDLVLLHDHIINYLRKKSHSGLTLFYGVPGTGKSTYIRYLISLVNKKVIFLPPKLAGNMDDPHVTRLLVENPDTIIVIEDAEDLLVSRDSNNNSAISMLLNLTDGLLGASLGIQFICTFNTKLDNIDKALLRKGRLTTLYEFKPLSSIKADQLLMGLGFRNYAPTYPMTLAEIYGADEREFEYVRKLNPIGFTSHVA